MKELKPLTKQKQQKFSLGLSRVKPLAIAVYSVLAGMSLTPSAADSTTPSPATISSTVTLPNGNNMVFSLTTSPATLTITSSGVLNYPDANTWLFCGRIVHTGAIDGNNITSYGTINGSTSHDVYLDGGFFANYQNTSYGAIQVNNNTVSLKAGSSTSNVEVYGGYVYVSSAEDDVTASGNTVFIEYGSEFSGNVNVVGGYASGQGVATASNNKVILGSGTYSATIYGGHARSYSSKHATVSNNTVYLYGDADVSAATINAGMSNILIGDSVAEGATLNMTGNTLVFGYNDTPWAPSNYTIDKVQNFSTIRFDNVVWGKTITINYFSNASTDSTETKIDATKVAFSGIEALSTGMNYNMLKINEFGSGSIGLTSSSSDFTVGTTLKGTGKVTLNDTDGDSKADTVVYTVQNTNNDDTGGNTDTNTDTNTSNDTTQIISNIAALSALTPQEQTHTAAMAMSAGSMALIQGADTTSAATFNLANSGATGLQAFSSVGGGASRVNTGSHVNLYTLNFSVGVGNNIKNDYGIFSIGGAFEAGFGNFKNHFNAGAAEPYIRKSGNISYYGIAAIASMTFDNLWHLNGALRFGHMESSQNDALYNPATMQTYNIKIKSNYLGVEIGGGRLIKFDDDNSLDLYAKYFYLYQNGDSFNAGGDYKLSAVNSHRLRLAGRLSHSFTKEVSLYGGLGAEYEFDGKSRLKVDGISAKSSTIDGFRGYGEMGIALKPSKDSGLLFDLNVKGLYGKDFRSVYLSADLKYMF